MMRVHGCPAHGVEECLMGESSKAHGCRRGGQFVFLGSTAEMSGVLPRTEMSTVNWRY